MQDQQKRSAHLVGFVMSHNGELHVGSASLSADEARSLSRLLDGLAEVGLIILPTVRPAPPPEEPGTSKADVAGYALRPLLAAVDAVQAGRAQRPGQPAAVMPVWPFAPDPAQPEVLLASGRLWGVDVHLEALPVEDGEPPVPEPSVAGRFQAWRRASGERSPAALRLPDRDGAYVLFASS